MSQALTIHQPWAWLIANGLKTFENRPRIYPKQTGWKLVHASKGMTASSYAAARAFVMERLGPHSRFPEPWELDHGGIVGRMFITCSTNFSSSPWFTGPKAYHIREAQPLPFHPCRGFQGWFEVPWLDAEPARVISARCDFCQAWERHHGSAPLVGVLDGCSCRA